MEMEQRIQRSRKIRHVELEVRMIDENDILLVSDDEPEFNLNRQDTSTWAVLNR